MPDERADPSAHRENNSTPFDDNRNASFTSGGNFSLKQPGVGPDCQHETPAVSIVVPCYNEVEGIQSCVERLKQHMKGLGAFEIVLVDDGSNDGSGEVIDALAEADHIVKIVRHQRNRGYGAALKSGIRRARAPHIAIIDADGTYPHSMLPELITKARRVDMVVGARTGNNVRIPPLRRGPKWLLNRYASWMARRDIPDINSGMRVMRSEVLKGFLGILPDSFSFTTTITLAMIMNHYEVLYVPIDYSPRIGRSKIRPLKDTIRFFGLVLRTGTYFAPLRVFLPVVMLLGGTALVSLISPG
jgi:glycosyltransferase involved in cell wall biosynthesis